MVVLGLKKHSVTSQTEIEHNERRHSIGCFRRWAGQAWGGSEKMKNGNQNRFLTNREK